MDEQNTTTPEPVTVSPDPVTQPAGEAYAPITETMQDNAPVEPPQAEPAEVSTEPTAVPESALNEPISEMTQQAKPETQTAQLAGNEPLPEPTPSAEVLIETPLVDALVSSTPIPETSPSEEVPPQAQPTTQQGTAQPEPPDAEPHLPAQAPTVSSTQTAPSIVRLLFEKAKLTIQLRKQKKFLKIIELLTKKGKITNDDVEKLLRVSDATATRYLSELEKQGKINQNGKTGKGVVYTKI